MNYLFDLPTELQDYIFHFALLSDLHSFLKKPKYTIDGNKIPLTHAWIIHRKIDHITYKPNSTINGKNIPISLIKSIARLQNLDLYPYKTYKSSPFLSYSPYKNYNLADAKYYEYWYNKIDYEDRIKSNEFYILTFRSPTFRSIVKHSTLKKLKQSCIDNGITNFKKGMYYKYYIRLLMKV